MSIPLTDLVWDWNGTLLDDTQACVNTLNQLLEARGIATLDVSRYRELFGFPVSDFYRRLGVRLELENWDELAETFHRVFLADPTLRLRVEAQAVLEQVAARGLRQTILSAAEQTMLEQMVVRAGIAQHFAHIVGSDNLHGRSKRDQGRALATTLAVPPGQVLLVGDTLHDADVARELGFHCVLVADGHQSSDRLAASGYPCLAAFADLPAWLDAAF